MLSLLITRNNNKNITKQNFCFPVVTDNVKLSFERLLWRNLKVLTFQHAKIQNSSAKIKVKYFKCHSIQSDGITHKVSKFLTSLRDTIQIWSFHRGISHCTPCHHDKNDHMWYENRSITTIMDWMYTECEQSCLWSKCLAQTIGQLMPYKFLSAWKK